MRLAQTVVLCGKYTIMQPFSDSPHALKMLTRNTLHGGHCMRLAQTVVLCGKYTIMQPFSDSPHALKMLT